MAQTISLPLDGYFRPGAYMPVMVLGATPASICATPGVACATPASAGVVPVYVLGATAQRVEVGKQSLPIHALADDQKLVGLATRDEPLAEALFPSDKVLTVDLDPTNPLLGPAIAWDSLDAVVLDAVDPKLIPQLLATGTTIAVRADAKPDQTWPWKPVADAWVLRPNPAATQPIQPDEAYAPTYGWRPARPSPVRQLIVVIALLSACVMVAIAMWRSAKSTWALFAFVLVFGVAFTAWRDRQLDVMSMTSLQRQDGEIAEIDRWTYQTSPVATKAVMEFESPTWPVFASAGQCESLRMVLECDATGQPSRFRYDLPANARMAFVTRSISP